MELTGKIKKIDETKTFGASGFRKRELVLTTTEQYPQMLLVEFVQDKCDLLNNFKVDQDVKIAINLRGREWINPQGESLVMLLFRLADLEFTHPCRSLPVNLPQGIPPAVAPQMD